MSIYILFYNKKIIYSYNKNLNLNMKYIRLFEKSIKEPAFISAAKRGNTNSVKQYIKDGIDINMKDYDGKTALMHAIKFPFVVDVLLEEHADVNATDKNKMTALMMASTLTIINKLLNANANVNIQDSYGETALMRYLTYFYDSNTFIIILEKFLKHGLNLDIKNKDGENFYDYVKNFKKYNNHKDDYIDYIEEFITNKFPQYKEEYDLKNDVNKFNL